MSICYRVTHKPTGAVYIVNAQDEAAAREFVRAHRGYNTEYTTDSLDVMIEA